MPDGSGPAADSPGPSPSTESDASTHERVARIGAVSTRTAAIIGVAGVLLSAGFSFASGLVSAHISSQSSVNAVAKQLSGETDRSRAEFTRSQRQVAYLSVVDDQQSLSELYDAMQQNLVDTPPTEKSPTAKYFTNSDRAADVEHKLDSSDSALVQIFSDSTTQQAYSNLLDRQSKRLLAIERVRKACIGTGTVRTSTCTDAYGTQGSASDDVEMAYTNLISQFKRELFE